MAKSWKDMTTEEKLEWLQHGDQSTRQMIAGISARLDEVAGVVIELEKQIKQAWITGQKGPPRPTLKLSRKN